MLAAAAGGATIIGAQSAIPLPAQDGPAPAASRPLNLDELLAAFMAGDPDVVRAQLRTRADFDRVRVDLFRAYERWRAAWQPSHAAFGLTVALIAVDQGWPNALGFLEAARDVVTSRPDPPGSNPTADAFERLFHRTVVAFLAGVPMPVEAESYLDSIGTRFTTGVRSRVRPPPIDDPRLVFARALAREARSLPAAAPSSGTLRTWIVPARDRTRRAALQQITAMLEAAEHDPAIAAEASVRHAFLQYRVGAFTPALQRLERADRSGDATVDYWNALIRGRALHALGRREEAISAYERARTLAPGAQTPAIALAALYLSVGQRSDAVAFALRARTTTDAEPDPWAQYWLGERRRFAGWLRQLQEARP